MLNVYIVSGGQKCETNDYQIIGQHGANTLSEVVDRVFQRATQQYPTQNTTKDSARMETSNKNRQKPVRAVDFATLRKRLSEWNRKLIPETGKCILKSRFCQVVYRPNTIAKKAVWSI